MSIFGGSKKEKKEKKAESVAPALKKEMATNSVFSLHNVIKHPRVTEKAAILSGERVYTFEVHADATKIDIARAVKDIYKVKPVRVNISISPAKRKIVRGKRGVTSAVKKALVYLKKGDTIEFV